MLLFFSVSGARARGVSRGALKIKNLPFFCHTSVIRSPPDQPRFRGGTGIKTVCQG
jgi:hypothetical protein